MLDKYNPEGKNFRREPVVNGGGTDIDVDVDIDTARGKKVKIQFISDKFKGRPVWAPFLVDKDIFILQERKYSKSLI